MSDSWVGSVDVPRLQQEPLRILDLDKLEDLLKIMDIDFLGVHVDVVLDDPVDHGVLDVTDISLLELLLKH